MNTALEVLRKARSLIKNEKDWCKGSAYNSEGQRCIIGAIDGALRYGQVHDVKFLQLLEELESYLPTDAGLTLVEFNDAASTSHADVLAVLDRAIAKEEKNDG